MADPTRATLPLARATPPLPPPRFTGSSAAALIHAGIGLLIATTMLIEPPGGYGVAVWQGPRSLVAWLPGDPWAIWAGLIAGPCVAIVIARGAPWSRWPLAALACCWGAFGGGALHAGLTSTEAASVAGWLLMGLAVTCIRDALALGRRRS